MLGVLLALRTMEAPAVQPTPAPVVQPEPESPAKPQAATPPSSAPADEPWSYRVLRSGDLDNAPRAESFPTAPPHATLTVLAGRRGELD